MKSQPPPTSLLQDQIPHFRKALPTVTHRSLKQKKDLPSNPRILFVTPEITRVPVEMASGARYIRAKAGGMAEVSASLVEQLQAGGHDVHLAIPHYRNLFKGNSSEVEALQHSLAGDSRVHLAEDSAFYRRVSAYHGNLLTASLAFQREVINHIIPIVKPDIVHCNDWMTGLIPAACRRLGIKTLFTVHNIHRERTTLAEIESRGIDASEFWESLHYENYPYSFEQSYHHNRIDLLASAITNADFVTTVSPTFLREMMHGTHGDLPESVEWDLHTKIEAGYAAGILNSPDSSFDPHTDPAIAQNFDSATHHEGKSLNKIVLQKELGLNVDHEAPLLFWPSRLDPIQKGCQLLTDILHQVMSDYESDNLQLVIVGDGPFKCHFQDIVAMHHLEHRVAVCDFEEKLSRQAFAASDFVLMPSSFEPCGLPQMIGLHYGSIPIVHRTGGLHDTIDPFNEDYTKGNGIAFTYFDTNGLRWAIDTAMKFHHTAPDTKQGTISRVMREAELRFNKDAMFHQYLGVYHKLAEDLKNHDQHLTSLNPN